LLAFHRLTNRAASSASGLFLTFEVACPGASACVVTAIKKDFEVLSSSDASQAQKLASLKFLGHWVGDVHQPLHASKAQIPSIG
jgi:hypothetical protein